MIHAYTRVPIRVPKPQLVFMATTGTDCMVQDEEGMCHRPAGGLISRIEPTPICREFDIIREARSSLLSQSEHHSSRGSDPAVLAVFSLPVYSITLMTAIILTASHRLTVYHTASVR